MQTAPIRLYSSGCLAKKFSADPYHRKHRGCDVYSGKDTRIGRTTLKMAVFKASGDADDKNIVEKIRKP